MKSALIMVLAPALVLMAQGQPPATADSSAARTPILVELFTSEGCSDCPPADAFLQKLDQQPFPRAEMIVLSEHVDYWNHDGWRDPYSSHFYSERQEAYASEFALRSVYTPQMVVDGSSEFVGGNQAAASKAFAKAATAPKIGMRLSSISVDATNTLHAHVETAALPKGQKADVYLAVALNHAESHVSGGENAGRSLSHTAVARSMTKVGSLRSGEAFTQDIELKLAPELAAANLRLVAFVQEAHQGRVFGATEQRVSPTKSQ
jgi:hypothetical protein